MNYEEILAQVIAFLQQEHSSEACEPLPGEAIA